MRFNKKTSVLLCSLALFGCGDDSQNNDKKSTPPEVPEITVISGLASSGGPIKGSLSLVEAQNDSSGMQVHSLIMNSSAESNVYDGSFVLEHADELSFPTLLKVEGIHGVSETTQFSLLLDNTHSRINISPLTRLLVSRVAQSDADVVYENFAQYQDVFTQRAIEEAQQELKAVISPLLSAAGVDMNVDLFSDDYDADFTDLDAVLSTLDVEYQENKAVLTYIPNSAYSVELAYDSSWQNLSLIPNTEDQAILVQELNVIYQANELLESMVMLKNDKPSFDALLAPSAHWFGDERDNIHSNYFNIQPNEQDPDFNRYRDIVILDSDQENNRYLMGYTTAFEASLSTSIARDQAWVEYNDQGELKFLGDDKPYPTSSYVLYKLNSYAADYHWSGQDVFEWGLETTGFLSSEQCQNVPVSGPWQWPLDSFIPTLPSVSLIDSNLLYVTVTADGVDQVNDMQVKLDRIYHDPIDGACHLVDSKGYSAIMNTYPINVVAANEPDSVNNIPTDVVYNITYVYSETDLSENLVKKVYLTQAPQIKAEMDEYLAQKVTINGAYGEFYYDWTRSNPFVVEGDLYVYGTDGVSYRMQIPDDQTEVSATTEELPVDATSVYHNGFDPFGRVVMNNYLSMGGAPLN